VWNGFGWTRKACMNFGSMKVRKYLEYLSEQQLMNETCSIVISKLYFVPYRP